MNYSFLPELILRNPSLSYANYSAAYAAELCRNDFFKGAILLASESFYRELEKKQFRAELLNARQVTTLMKYVNRMCFRPTPFGLFSGFSEVRWNRSASKIRIGSLKGKVHLHADQGLSLALGNVLRTKLEPYTSYRTNPSVYPAGKEYHYLLTHKIPGATRLGFGLQSFPSSPLIHSLLGFCSGYRTISEITGVIRKKTGCDQEEALRFLLALAQKQVLESIDAPSVTGKACELMLLDRCAALGISDPATETVRELTTFLYGYSLPDTVITQKISENLVKLDIQTSGRSHFYAAYENRSAAALLDDAILASIVDGLSCLDRLQPEPEEVPALHQFKEDYARKFEGRTVPLLLALDPEAGVGYGHSSAHDHKDEILETLQFTKEEQPVAKLDWTATHQLLLRLWNKQAASESSPVIRLTAADLQEIPASRGKFKYPTGFPVLFRVIDEKIYLEQAGGISPTSMIGRFSLFSDKVRDMAQQLAREEEAHNPDVVFAEIVHLCDEHVDNINRRALVRNLEIPVLCRSVLPQEAQLSLKELFVTVHNGEVILYSSRLKKRVIPRLSSAFNYLRNDLPLFRFLCDLQYQGIKSSFTLDLARLFPQLHFYPRIEYLQSILHLASWHFKASDLPALSPASREKAIAMLQDFLSQHHLPRYFSLTRNDHQLVFDTANEADLLLFRDSVKQAGDFVLKEFIPEKQAVVKDEAGRPYIHQFLTCAYNLDRVYLPYSLSTRSHGSARRKFVPGSDWLYLKIYCHPSRANELMARYLLPAIAGAGKNIPWFFVRYVDPSFHIRIRLQVPADQASTFLSTCHERLRHAVESEQIEKIQTDTYFRELERYGEQTMEEAETVFYQSSALVAAYIKRFERGGAAHNYYSFALYTVNEQLKRIFPQVTERLAFLHQAYHGFLGEYDKQRELKVQLDLRFRRFRKEIEKALNDPHYLADLRLASRFRGLCRATDQLKAQTIALSPAEQARLYADILHMHLNRIFVRDARKLELTTYYFLYKFNLAGQKTAAKHPA